ncbi:MAG: hypothetical protein GY801_18385 [bacterium]|nr:hypothetical protein [bacterium]
MSNRDVLLALRSTEKRFEMPDKVSQLRLKAIELSVLFTFMSKGEICLVFGSN